jgi:hypothetical protein
MISVTSDGRSFPFWNTGCVGRFIDPKLELDEV